MSPYKTRQRAEDQAVIQDVSVDELKSLFLSLVEEWTKKKKGGMEKKVCVLVVGGQPITKLSCCVGKLVLFLNKWDKGSVCKSMMKGK